jgi:hypothetical protein
VLSRELLRCLARSRAELNFAVGRLVCEHLAYRSGIFRQLESLTNLDGQRFVEDEATQALKYAPFSLCACLLRHQLTRFCLPLGLLSRRAPVQPVAAPTVTIPAYERWVPSQFWDDALVKPESVAQPQSVVMESVLRDCQKLDASAQVLLDRCNGFANVKGVMSS